MHKIVPSLAINVVVDAFNIILSYISAENQNLQSSRFKKKKIITKPNIFVKIHVYSHCYGTAGEQSNTAGV